jgi:hypothetical protein
MSVDDGYSHRGARRQIGRAHRAAPNTQKLGFKSRNPSRRKRFAHAGGSRIDKPRGWAKVEVDRRRLLVPQNPLPNPSERSFYTQHKNRESNPTTRTEEKNRIRGRWSSSEDANREDGRKSMSIDDGYSHGGPRTQIHRVQRVAGTAKTRI